MPSIYRLAAASVLVASLSSHAMSQAPAEAPPVPVSVVKVERRDMPIVASGIGTAQAWYSVLLRTQVDGKLIDIAVTEGQDVKKGDLLATIDPRPFQAALDAALAKQRQDEALLVAAKLDLARYTALAARDVASRQKVETLQGTVGQLTAAIAADAALADAARVNLGFCSIVAPFDGRVGLRTIDPGNFVRAAEATAIMPVAQLKPIAVTFTVPQERLADIQAAMKAGKPPVIAMSADNSREIARGELVTIDNTVDVATGTIKMKASFPNEDVALWPGQFVNAKLVLGIEKGALMLPSAAVMHGQDRMYVYAVGDNNTVQAKTVKISRDDGVWVSLASGVEAGQTIVNSGQSRLRGGSKIATAPQGAPQGAPAAAKTGG